jgi:hypothetical protein
MVQEKAFLLVESPVGSGSWRLNGWVHGCLTVKDSAGDRTSDGTGYPLIYDSLTLIGSGGCSTIAAHIPQRPPGQEDAKLSSKVHQRGPAIQISASDHSFRPCIQSDITRVDLDSKRREASASILRLTLLRDKGCCTIDRLTGPLIVQVDDLTTQ